MKATVQRRLTLLVGMLLLSLLLVLAIGAPLAQATLAAGSGSGGGSLTTSAAGSGAQAGPSGTSSTTYWLIGSAVAVLIVGVGAWVIARRRKQHEEAPACELSGAGC